MNQSAPEKSGLPAIVQWTPPGRSLIFLLAGTSIWCLLSEMYGLCDMRKFFYAILLPATVLLYAIAILDRAKGDGRLFRGVIIGTLGGLAAAVAYDIFRLPFVYSNAWGMGRFGIPQMPLYKVFPRFGALLLGQPLEQPSYSTAAHLLGWAYHFSNGATFGVMFVTMIAGAREAIGAARAGSWGPVLWGVVMAVGIEICLLLSPYDKFFGIKLNTQFVVVTLTAHLIFGIGLGLYYIWHTRKWRITLGGVVPMPAI